MPFSRDARWWLVSLSITAWVSFRCLPILLRELEGWWDILAIIGFPVLVWWVVVMLLALVVALLQRDK